MPDLFNYLLSGVMKSEYTIATTGQYIDAHKKDVLSDVLKQLGIDEGLFAEQVMAGTVIGPITDEIAVETGITKDTLVIAVGGHDTASAVAATPFEYSSEAKDAAFLSCGTWSLLGVELDEPLINDDTFKYNYTNEGGVENTIRFLKNINGLWVIQQLRNCWNEQNKPVSFPEIIAEAEQLHDSGFCIDVSDPAFNAPLNMIDEIKAHCSAKGQGTPETLGELAIAVYNGLTDEYNRTVVNLEKLTGKTLNKIHMIGGGTRDELLCRLTARATGKTVIAGPVEGSIIGNVIMQLKALGKIETLEQGRKIVADSFERKVYHP